MSMKATLLRRCLLILLLISVSGAVLIELVALYGGYADQRFLLVLLIWLLVPVAVLPGSVNFKSWLVAGWGVFVLSIVLSTGLEIGHPSEMVEAILYPAYLAAIAGGVYWMRACGNSRELTVQFVLLAAAVMVLYALIAIMIYGFVLLDGLRSVGEHLPWGFYNIRFWSQVNTFLLPLLPLAVLAGPLKNHRLWRSAVALTGGIWWWLLLITMGRGSLLGLLVALLAVVILFGRTSYPWARVFVGYFVAGIGIWLLLSWLMPMLMGEGVVQRKMGATSSGRIHLWVESWQMSLQNFPLGMGPLSWNTHAPITEAYAASRNFSNPHNMYLMWAAEFGWLGLCGLLTMAIVAWRRFRTRQAEVLAGTVPAESSMLFIGITASVIAALVHGSVSAVFISPGSMLVGLWVLAAFWVHVSVDPNKEKILFSGPLKVGRFVLVMVAVLIMSFWVAQVSIYYQEMNNDLIEGNGYPGIMKPRFWLHGDFPRHEMPPE